MLISEGVFDHEAVGNGCREDGRMFTLAKTQINVHTFLLWGKEEQGRD